MVKNTFKTKLSEMFSLSPEVPDAGGGQKGGEFVWFDGIIS